MISQKQVLFATAPKGLEYLLAQELTQLGAQDVKEKRAGVSFVGDLYLAYKACLWSRLANRILMPLASFHAPDPESLYQGIQQISWDEHLKVEGSLAVDFSNNQSQINHSQYGAQKVKDAIVDQFRMRFGKRPNVDLKRPDLKINVYLHKDIAIISIDLSGDSLHKRSYRIDIGGAPLKENLAAAILLRAGWPATAAAGGMFVDPFCGSGTLLIEAAWIAADIAPGLQREYFGFIHWLQHKPEYWEEIKAEAKHRCHEGLKKMPSIQGFDADPSAIRNARANIARANLTDYIKIACCELAYSKSLITNKNISGMIVTNPPYGERLGHKPQLLYLYQHLGNMLREHFQSWQAAILVSDVALGKQLGMRAIAKYNFYNGALPCVLLLFTLEEDFFYKRRQVNAISIKQIPENFDSKIEMFINRLQKNIKNLKKWAKKEKITCYRVYDADLPEYAVAIDFYQQQWVHIQEYAPPKTIDPEKAEQRLAAIIAVLPNILQISKEHIYLKIREKQRGNNQYQKMSKCGGFQIVTEGSAKFLVNFTDYLDTGLFLDHRITRKMISILAKEKSFLNLFAYTGTASICAALGGALSTTSVDLSNTYLDWAKYNLSLNGLTEIKNNFIQADCIEWLKINREKFDLIFLDPPTFSNSKRMQGILDIQRDHVTLIRQAMKHLTQKGILIFSTNRYNFKLEKNSLADFQLIDITTQTISKDFERNPKIHQCWKILPKFY